MFYWDFLLQVQSLSLSMSEKDNATGTLHDKISQLQKLLTVSEHDRRVLQVNNIIVNLTHNAKRFQLTFLV